MLMLPEAKKSIWREVYSNTSIYPELTEDLEVDAVIVGAGITGLTAAYLLKKSGHKVAVLDKDSVGGGTTGRTTGKVSSLHNLIYSDFASRLGEKTARIYGEANQAAIETVERIVEEAKIDCEWRREDNYTYTADKRQIDKFKKEAETAASLGLPSTFETTTPLPFPVEAAVKFSGQGTFHSQNYVSGLARAIDGGGSYVFEDSAVIGFRDGEPARVRTKKAKVIAKDIIVATNVPAFPLMARGCYCMLEYPTESYIVAGPLKKWQPGMYISPDDGHYSILPVKLGGQQSLLIGGESNISGLRGKTEAKYLRLAHYAEKHFGITDLTHKWSDRDYMTYDGIPLAGRTYPWSKHLYVASAFRKWGLTNGTASAMILHDLISGINNKWAHTFRPTRVSPIASIPRVAFKYLTGQA